MLLEDVNNRENPDVEYKRTLPYLQVFWKSKTILNFKIYFKIFRSLTWKKIKQF